MVTLVIVISVFFSASAQLLLKKGMQSVPLPNPATATASSVIDTILAVITNFYLIAGVSFHIIALITWLYVLKHAEVSYAYPFISLGFVFVLIAGYMLFNESLNAEKVVGIATIIIGIFLLSRS